MMHAIGLLHAAANFVANHGPAYLAPHKKPDLNVCGQVGEVGMRYEPVDGPDRTRRAMVNVFGPPIKKRPDQAPTFQSM